ncbi:MAG: hypothetical protein ABL889_04380 [Terricaulis sp.]
MSAATPALDETLALCAANLAFMRELLKAFPQVRERPTGAELLEALDCASISATRFGLELAIEAGDVEFEDAAIAAERD